MRILLLTHAFNSLSQRLFVELQERGHEVSVEFDINDSVSVEAVHLFKPELIIAPFLKRAIPKSIWNNQVCFIVHPGIPGDRGPSALDWAIINAERIWGVTVLQANAEMDAGDIWASYPFPMRSTTKASLYRNEVITAAVEAVLLAIERFKTGDFKPQTLNLNNDVKISGSLHPLMKQSSRSIDWQNDNTQTVLRKIHSADGVPGVADTLFSRPLYLYDVHKENVLHGKAGEVIARCMGAVCRATIDGAVWIGHLRNKHAHLAFKLPATHVLAKETEHLPEITANSDTGYRDIWYEEKDAVGYLYFPFYNGAMGTEQCKRLRKAYQTACQCDTKIIVLMGGTDYWSNGMHLNLIEAAESPADESWNNINAIDDLALEIINTETHLTIAALCGNAGAGGVFLARAADLVWSRDGVILNPHYKDMGNLYGSEYWTYLLPRYTGEVNAKRITQSRLPMGINEAMSLGLVDKVFQSDAQRFSSMVKKQTAEIINSTNYYQILNDKNNQRIADTIEKPLQNYRDNELKNMHLNFYGFDPSYHIARYNFVYKAAKSRTPITIAQHRRIDNTGLKIQ